MENRYGEKTIAFAIAVLAAAALLRCCATAGAQRAITPQLALARICWHEGERSTEQGCAAIHAVIERVARAGRTSYVVAAERYSGRVFDVNRRDEAAYVPHLQPEHGRPRSEAPTGWPTQIYRRRGGQVVVIQHAPWSAFRERWASVYEMAGRVIRGELTHACEVPPEHWGCPDCGDRERAEERGWTRINCGETNNDFWIIPRRVE